MDAESFERVYDSLQEFHAFFAASFTPSKGSGRVRRGAPVSLPLATSPFAISITTTLDRKKTLPTSPKSPAYALDSFVALHFPKLFQAKNRPNWGSVVVILEVTLGLQLLVPVGGGLPDLPVETGPLRAELLVGGQHTAVPKRVHPVPYPVLPHRLRQGPFRHVVPVTLVEPDLGARTDDPPPVLGARGHRARVQVRRFSRSTI